MKAIRVQEFGGPEVLRLEEVPDPKPGAGQVVVRIQGGRRQPRRYLHPRRDLRRASPRFPTRPARDGAGTRRIRRGGRDARQGRATACTSLASFTGTYAELALFDEWSVLAAARRILFFAGRRESHVPYATAFRALLPAGAGAAGVKPSWCTARAEALG